MTEPAGEETTFFYASGQRIPLTRDPERSAFFSEDLEHLELGEDTDRRIADATQTLVRGVVMFYYPELGSECVTDLEKRLTPQPVYRHRDALVVVLPEVRVEEAREGRAEEVEAWLEAHSEQVEVIDRRSDRWALRPASGRGEDALTVANQLFEELKPELAQARFIRIVPRKFAPGSPGVPGSTIA